MSVKAIWILLRTAAEAWVDDNSPRLGAALSYYTLFAISPLFIIVIFIASLWLDQYSVRQQLFQELANLIGSKGAQAIQSALTTAIPHHQGLLASVIAIGTLLISSTGLFMELQGALNTVWGVQSRPGQGVRGFVRGRLLSFAMVLGIGFLLLVSLIISTALSLAGKYLSGLIPGLGMLWMLVNAGLSFAVITVLFAMIFKVLPDVKISWGDVWVGALITALLFTAGKFLLGLYLGRSSTVSAYGAAGSVVLILLWVYYSAQILFFGAEITQAYANQLGARLEPKAHAQWIRPEAAQAWAQKKQAAASPPDRKAELITELRAEVEALRAMVRQRSEEHGAS